MLIVFVTIFFILFAVLCWKKINWAVALTVFSLPSYLIRFEVGGIPFTVLEGMILVLFVVFLIRWIKVNKGEKKWKIELSNYKWLMLVFLITATLGIYFSADRMAGLGIWKAYFIEPILFFVVFINVFQQDKRDKLVSETSKNWQLLIWAIGLSALLVAIPAIVQKFTGWGISNEFWFAEETRRVVSWYGFPNAVGLYLSPIVLLFIGLTMNRIARNCTELRRIKKEFKRIIFPASVVVLSLAAIVFARSEGALIGIVAGIFVLGLIWPKKKVRIISLVSLVSLILLVSLVPQTRNYATFKVLLRDHSGQIRVQQWKETWSMFKDGKMVTGAGLSGYQLAVAPYHAEGIFIQDYQDPEWLRKVLFNDEARVKAWQPTEIYMYPHNIFLNFWSEIGMVGLLCILALMFVFLRGLKEAKGGNQKLYLILIAVFTVIFVHGLVDVPYFKNDLSVFWWLLLGMGYLLTKKASFFSP